MGLWRRKKIDSKEDASNEDVEGGPSTDVLKDVDIEDNNVYEDEDDRKLDPSAVEAELLGKDNDLMPCGRVNSAVMIQNNVLKSTGGMIEKPIIRFHKMTFKQLTLISSKNLLNSNQCLNNAWSELLLAKITMMMMETAMKTKKRVKMSALNETKMMM